MLALTHISPRYSGGQVRDEAREIFENVVVPRDFDRIEIPFPERANPCWCAAPRARRSRWPRSSRASSGPPCRLLLG